MVTMPDGAQFEMQWKQVKYINGGHSVIFEIVPMVQGHDFIIFLTATQWAENQNVFSEQERMEIIFLLERIGWKRDIRVVEAGIEPVIDSESIPIDGSIESTSGFQEMAAKSLFDPNSPLNKLEVKEIYSILERRFAEGVSGLVTIPKDIVLRGSILEQISIPVLKKNESVKLQLI